MTEKPKRQRWAGVVPPGTWRPPRDGGYRGCSDPEWEGLPPAPKGRAGTSPPPGQRTR